MAVGRQADMNRNQQLAVFFILAWYAGNAQAHVMNPIYYPLGPLPFLLIGDLPLFACVIPVTILTTTLVLWAWIRSPGFMGHLWRGTSLYIVARVFETGMLFAIERVAPRWASSSLEPFGTLAACLFAGLIPATLFGLFIYRASFVSKQRQVVAMAMAIVSGYFVAYVSGLLLIMMR